MKHLGSFMNKIVVCTLSLLAASFLTTQAAEKQGKAEVRAVRGSAKYSTGGGQWLPLKVGTVLRSGSVIQTAQASTVDLFLGQNGPVVRVTEDTQMAFDKLSLTTGGDEPVIETQLDLKSGRILGNVKKLAAASRYEIKTPTGVAGIRGTEFDISANGTFTIVRGEGNIRYFPNFGGRSHVVRTGQTVTPSSTAPTEIPQAERDTLIDEIEGIGRDIREIPVTPDIPVRDATPTTGPTGNNNDGGFVF